MFWSNPKDVDTKDRYGATIDPKWLGEENIMSVVFTPPVDSSIVVTETNVAGNIVSAFFSGGVEGFHDVHLRVDTPTRSIEREITIWVNNYVA